MGVVGRRRDEEGGVELFVLVLIPVMLLALGLVVDLGGYLRAGDRAAWCAQQAARAATGRLDLDQVQAAGTAVVGGDAAVVTAQQMAVAAGMVGTATINADGSLTATCTAEYEPIILAGPGLTTWHVTEQATSRPARGITEEE
jgi:Flp pilus assembly protein TadG